MHLFSIFVKFFLVHCFFHISEIFLLVLHNFVCIFLAIIHYFIVVFILQPILKKLFFILNFMNFKIIL